MRAVIVGMCTAVLLAGGCGSSGERADPPVVPVVSSAPAESPSPGDHRLTLRAGDVDRTYLLHAPPGFTPGTPLPLVIALHFRPGSGSQLRDMIGMDALADRHGFLVAYPDGLYREFNGIVCCGKADDVGYLRELAAHLTSAWSVDPARVYLTGISNGGDMAYRATVETPGVYAAVAVISGGYVGSRADAADYVPRGPTPLLTVIGTADREFGRFSTGIARWQERLRCVPSAAPAPAPEVSHTVARCADGSDVEVYVVTGMGHVWPGAQGGLLAQPVAPVNATDLIWQFFATRRRA